MRLEAIDRFSRDERHVIEQVLVGLLVKRNATTGDVAALRRAAAKG